MAKQFLVVRKDKNLSKLKKSLIQDGVIVSKIQLAKKDKRLSEGGFKGVNVTFRRKK
jgi:hypothetical protein|tara:strand:- start:9 stop:179 length:171 start_codon:yes stop_codon:yes gene_type:complete